MPLMMTLQHSMVQTILVQLPHLSGLLPIHLALIVQTILSATL